jgi:hypothetical protein
MPDGQSRRPRATSATIVGAGPAALAVSRSGVVGAGGFHDASRASIPQAALRCACLIHHPTNAPDSAFRARLSRTRQKAMLSSKTELTQFAHTYVGVD